MSKFSDKEYREIVMRDTMKAVEGCHGLDARIVLFEDSPKAPIIFVECFEVTDEARRRLTMLVDSGDFEIGTPRHNSRITLRQEI